MALILKRAALFDGELGAGEQDIGHAGILPDRQPVAFKQVNPASSVLAGTERNYRPPRLTITPRDETAL